MKETQLQHYNGAAIDISVDGSEAIGILFVSDRNEVYVMTLCYTKRRAKCPKVQHVLSPEEIQNITFKDRNKLHSSIDVSSIMQAAPAPRVEANSSSDPLARRMQNARHSRPTLTS